MSGTLYLVSTPIGNLGDMSARALDTLRDCDFVAAEDTRVAMKLLSCFDIHKPIVSYHEHNKLARGDEIIARIQNGENCALTTDAGTPAISDPGADLVAQCRLAGIPVRTVPGACAAVAAFSLYGIAGRFTFEGFLSVKRPSRKAHLESLKNETRPMIFYEAPHKLCPTLRDFAATFGADRGILLARELTKLHEESVRMTIGEAVAFYRVNEPRGEYVLIVDGAPEAAGKPVVDPNEIARAYVASGMSPSEAAKLAARETNMPRNAIYRALLEDEQDESDSEDSSEDNIS